MDSDGVELFMGHADRMEDHFDERLEVIHFKISICRKNFIQTLVTL